MRVLMAVSGGSIAHSLRPIPVAQILRRRGAEVFFGGEGPYLRFAKAENFAVHPLCTLPYERVLRWMSSDCVVLYDPRHIDQIVDRQAAQIRAVKPNLILQDGADVTLSIAAAVCGCPIYNLTNATTQGLAGSMRYVAFRPRLLGLLNEHPRLTRLADRSIGLARNLALFGPLLLHLARRKRFDAGFEHILMPDLPELFGSPPLDDKHSFVGPILYEPTTAYPDWWSQLDDKRPLIYVAVGSSGGRAGLDVIVETLNSVNAQVVLSTAAAFEPGQLPGNFFTAPLVPREELLAKTHLLIYHGGSATTYQAIAAEVPMLAIPGHFDQDFNARAVVKQGLGRSVLPVQLGVARLRRHVEELLHGDDVRQRLTEFGPKVRASQGAERVCDRLIRDHEQRARFNRPNRARRRRPSRWKT